MASRACMVFLNGEYWGYQNLRERVDGFYLESHYGVDNDQVDLIESQNSAIEGDNSHWNAMVNFIYANDLSIPGNYEYLKTQMDVENFAVYNSYEIFLANTDWPDHNIKRWRPKVAGGLWRWVYFDMDLSLNAGSGIPSYNMLDMATNPDEGAYGTPYWSSLILRKLLLNEDFRNLFLSHYTDRLNSVFLPERMHAVMDSVQAAIAPEIPRHRERWEHSQTWSARLLSIRNFINERPDYARGNLLSFFSLGDTVRLELDVNPPGAGRIVLTAVTVDSTWSGVYFEGVPIALEALPAEGWIFDSWSDPLLSGAEQVFVTLQGDSALVAGFIEGDGGRAVINEINYKSNPLFDCGDWVEFHNPGATAVDMSGWEFRDDNDTHFYEFPGESVLSAEGFMVLASDRLEFLEHFPDVGGLLPGQMDFGLGSDDMARLYNRLGELQDIVIYSNSGPWPPDPDGGGPTLELIDPHWDNIVAESWAASVAEHGTPGERNSVSDLVTAPECETPTALFMAAPSPNPFNPETEICFGLPESGCVELAIYDVRGRLQRRLISESMKAGWYSQSWDGRDGRGRLLSTGIYLALLRSGGERVSRKLVLIK